MRLAGQLPHIACCDGRIDPEKIFGLSRAELNEDTDAITVRNAGGRAEFAVRDLLVLDTLVGLKDVIVLHHTDCGLTHITDEELRKAVKGKVPRKESEIDNMKFGEIANLEEAVQTDVKFLKSSPYLKEELKVHGYIFDLKTGLLQTVVE
ncbi:hypothetical protein MMC30_002187 [Trapelia coarctata]|nr:hypothetical protein [Trapelia coarctata]